MKPVVGGFLTGCGAILCAIAATYFGLAHSIAFVWAWATGTLVALRGDGKFAGRLTAYFLGLFVAWWACTLLFGEGMAWSLLEPDAAQAYVQPVT